MHSLRRLTSTFVGAADTCRCLLSGETAIDRYVTIVAITIWALMPVWQLYGPAVISTSTLKLLNQLNELRACCYDPEDASKFAGRATRLVEYLNDSNSRRGPGFVMFGVVINLKVLVSANMFDYCELVVTPQSLCLKTNRYCTYVATSGRHRRYCLFNRYVYAEEGWRDGEPLANFMRVFRVNEIKILYSDRTLITNLVSQNWFAANIFFLPKPPSSFLEHEHPHLEPCKFFG
eukprot:COSAG01_NODE_5342_length_4324_cov_2.688521_4_plen_233_part_00